jgi:hypothetical protein
LALWTNDIEGVGRCFSFVYLQTGIALWTRNNHNDKAYRFGLIVESEAHGLG